MNNNNTSNRYFPASNDFDLSQFPFYGISRLEALYNLEIEKNLKTIGLNASRWRVCLLLHTHKSLSISDIAKETLGKIPTITKMVYHMQNEGLVDIEISRADARVRMVSLTPKGKQKVNDILTTTHPLLNAIFTDISDQDIEQLNHLIYRLFDNLNQYRQPCYQHG
ncbi:MAG: MarR family transcriptional regulator [Gammaproteobacteria bacterium]|nr:MAG: MarR family transcriptional regulator [Gammaproteobacteria bacterium]